MKGYNVDEIEFEDDSNLTTPELLTGEYLTSIGKNVQPNAEVEGGEYVQFPDKETQKVAGKDHEQGGVPVNIPDGTKVLSKSLNLSKQQVKMLKDIFDIELTTKDNYAAALDKYTKKIGLKKLNDEQEDVFKSLEKTLDKTKDQKTLRLNKAFISEKIQEIGNKKEPLEKQRAQFFDTLFELQEKSKADKGDEEAMFRYGGIQKTKFDAIATKLGLDPEQAAIMLRAKREGTIPKYEDGGKKGGDPTSAQALKPIPPGQRRGKSFYGKVNEDMFRQTREANPWFNWTNFDPSKKEDVKRFQGEYNQLIEKYKLPANQVKIDGMFGEQTQSIKVDYGVADKEVTEKVQENKLPPEAKIEVEKTKPPGTGTRIEDKVRTTPKPTYPRAFFMPDQSVMPPTPPEAHLKANIRLDRIDPLRIGIDQTIQDTADQRNFVTDQLDSLPESQRAAITANLLANSQKTVSDAATKANMVNAQNYSQAELFNIQQRGQEQMFGSQNALDFERRQFTANAKYDESLRNYFDYNRKVNTTNFQNQQKLNLIDSLFPDYDLDYMGASVSYNPKSEWQPTVTGLGNTGEQLTKEQWEAQQKEFEAKNKSKKDNEKTLADLLFK